MTFNPEFQRQLYLECSEARFIGTPLVLGIIFTGSYYIDGQQLGAATAKTALVVFLLITLLWGARQSMDSIMDEFREGTWDTQRLSTLTPWEMVWGKILGSTVMVWYAGVLCLLVFAVATNNVAAPLIVFYSLGAALLFQAAGAWLGLLALQRGQGKTNAMYVPIIIGFIFIAPKLIGFNSDTPPIDLSLITGLSPNTWYGIALSEQSLSQFNLAAGLFWCYIANYRLMAQALGIRTLPWVWLAFILFLIVYLGGLLPNIGYAFVLLGFMICSVLTYGSILLERNDAMRLKRLSQYWQQHNLSRFAQEIPIWSISLLLAVPFALVLSISEHPFGSLGVMMHFYPLPILLLLLRDCGVYLYFSYGKNPQRALTLTLLVAVLLYGIIPGIFTAAGASGLAALFFPLWADSTGVALLLAATQTAVVLNLLYQRWQKRV